MFDALAVDKAIDSAQKLLPILDKEVGRNMVGLL
jgi:hypothetical protein